jgi:hypothetical protein
MFNEVFERFIQNRPIAVMVRVLLESFLNADQVDRWFDTVRQSQYTKDIVFSSIVGLMLNVVWVVFLKWILCSFLITMLDYFFPFRLRIFSFGGTDPWC